MLKLDLDIEQFWKDEETAHLDNCFSKEAKQVALGIRMHDECVFTELGEPGSPWGYTPLERRIELNKRYNDKAEKIVGRRLLREDYSDAVYFPEFRMIGEVFGGRYEFDGNTTWLKQGCDTPEELEAILDRIDRMDTDAFRAFVLPQNWDSEVKKIYETTGKRPGQYRSVRGPVTLAASVFGVENLLFLYYDAPELFARFSDTICRVILMYVDLFRKEAGCGADDWTHGFSFYDDDCCLMTPEMYEMFGYPVLKKVFEYTSPLPEDNRFQHSDSAMGHLLPILGRLDLKGCNFGPTLTVREIRKYMPHTRIDGQLAPFTFMRNDTDAIIAEVRRDCEMAKEGDLRGLNLATAGSINDGSLLTSMRTVMAAIQTYGRY